MSVFDVFGSSSTRFSTENLTLSNKPAWKDVLDTMISEGCHPETVDEVTLFIEAISDALKHGSHSDAERGLQALTRCSLTSITQLLVDSAFLAETDIFPNQALLTEAQIERLITLCASVQFEEINHYFCSVHVKLLRLKYGSAANQDYVAQLISEQKRLIMRLIDKLEPSDIKQIRSGLILIAKNGGAEFFYQAYNKFKSRLSNFDIGIIMMSFPRMKPHLERQILQVCINLFLERKDQFSVNECTNILHFIPLSEAAKQEMITFVRSHRPDIQ